MHAASIQTDDHSDSACQSCPLTLANSEQSPRVSRLEGWNDSFSGSSDDMLMYLDETQQAVHDTQKKE